MHRIAQAAGTLGLLLAMAPAAFAADTPAPAPPAVTAGAPAAAAAANRMELTWNKNPYDNSLGLNFPLTDKPIPTIQSDDEAVILRDLMEDSLVPRYMLLQADVYTVPVLGTYLKSHSPHTYKKGDLGYTGVNLVESSSTSYQDPWALSAFFGNIADLQLPGQAHGDNDVGYSGWLVSAGAQHLKDNELIQDRWYKLEWQTRGDLDGQQEKMAWSLRIGSKFNANPYITDVTYIGFSRSNLDFSQPVLSWLKNSHVDVELEFSHDGGRVVREKFVIGKKYPFPDEGYTLTLDTGLVWDSPYEYSGPLRDNPKADVTLVLQPGIEF